MITKVASFIRNHNLIHKNDIITVAVSGGRDSMALLYGLNILKDEFSFELRSCHINHGLRGNDSDLDEELVRDKCNDLSVPLRVERLTGFDLNSSEDKLRQARYEIFQQILLESPKIKIATAHHLNDQIETFLMRLAKGSYHKGLTAIPVARTGFIRPFLNLKREEIDAFVNRHKIPFREDFTNNDTAKLRNKIRHNLIPVLIATFGKEFYAGFDKSINDLRESYEDYTRLVREHFAENIKKENGVITLGRQEYQQFADIRKRLFIEYCISLLNPLNSNPIKYSFKEFERFVNGAQTGAMFHINADVKALIDRDDIRFFVSAKDESIDALIYLNENIETEHCVLSVESFDAHKIEYNSDKSVEYICGDRLQFPLRLRNWRFGDSFYPLGLSGRQKLSDFFINKKIPVDIKKKILVLENSGDLIWVVGIQIDNRYKISNNCKQIIRLTHKTKKA